MPGIPLLEPAKLLLRFFKLKIVQVVQRLGSFYLHTELEIRIMVVSFFALGKGRQRDEAGKKGQIIF